MSVKPQIARSALKTRVLSSEDIPKDDADTNEQKQHAAIVIMTGDENGTVYEIKDGEITIGRGIENDIPMEYDEISRQHFKVTNESGEWCLVDLDSTNGTFVDDQKIQTNYLLTDGDVIQVGSHRFKYLSASSMEKDSYTELHFKAHHDLHTGCFNKAFFNNKIDLEVRRSQSSPDVSNLSVVMLDIDHFKKLNDTKGHDVGDFVLKGLAVLVTSHIRDEDSIFARYGGEEFVVLLIGTTLDQAAKVAERLRQAIEEYEFDYSGDIITITCSFGVSSYRDGVKDGVELFKNADKALYMSKNNGRNQIKRDIDVKDDL